MEGTVLWCNSKEIAIDIEKKYYQHELAPEDFGCLQGP